MESQSARRNILWLAWLVLAVSVAAAFWAYEAARDQVLQRDAGRFDTRVEMVKTSIKERMHVYEQVLRGASGLFAASKSVERGEWRAYLSSLNIEENYPGARGIAFVQRVKNQDLPAFAAAVRSEGFPDFSVRPAGIRADYLVVTYIEPMAANSGLLGYDIGADTAMRRPAAEQARDRDRPTMTGKIILANDTNMRSGFAFLLPIYSNSFPTETVYERRAAIQGWIYCPFDLARLMDGMRGSEGQDVDLEIFDGLEMDAGHLLFSTKSNPENPVLAGRPRFLLTAPIEVGDRLWLLNVSSRPEFDAASDRAWPILVLVIGLLGSFLLFSITWSLATTRRRALAQAETMTARLRSVLETASDAFIAADQTGVITDWNRQAELTFGWKRNEAIGRSIAELIIPPKYREPHTRGFKHFMETREGPILNRRVELSALHRDGREFPVEITVWPIHVGDAYTFNAFVYDITERRRAQKDLLQARYAAEAANQSKSEFLAHMSHELRAPLNSIIGFAQILQINKGKKFQDTELAYLDRILENANHLLTLINEVLDLSKVEAHRMRLDIESVDLEGFIRQTLDQMEDRVLGRPVKLVADLPRPMAPIDTDAVKLRQVLFNLIGNAVKFTEHGTITIRVVVDPESLAPERIDVIDTGIGISPTKLQSIFEPFEQVDPDSARKYGGTGLGLTICRSLCQLMGYRIEAQSDPGKGSLFSVIIPKEAAREWNASNPGVRRTKRPAAVATARIGEPAPAKFSGKIALIIDDEPDSRLLLSRHFEDLGFQVHSAGSAEQGVQMARETQPDLITVDLLMRNKNGWDLIREMRSDPDLGGVPLIVVSNIAEDNRASLGHADEVLNKPVTREALTEALRKNLRF